MYRWFLLALLSLGIIPSLPAAEQNYWVYFGTYTGGKSEGIYVAEFDANSGKLGEPTLATKVTQPSFLTIHPTGKFLYAVNETADYKKEKMGAISAFAIDSASGKLALLNDKGSGGGGPCYVTTDREGKFALAANYGGGSVCAYRIHDDGSLGERTGFIQHTGSSVNPARQKEPHAHSINVSPDNRFAYAADLGTDKIYIYQLDEKTGALTPSATPFVNAPTGGGPRHLAFNPRRPFVYVNNELLSSVTAYGYHAQSGELTPGQTISTLPEGAKANNSTAEVQVHPSGEFVYVSNRGHNSIAVFRVDSGSGQLTTVQHQTKDINVPRNFRLDPSGRWMFVANQQSDSVVVFKVDAKTGELEPTDQRIALGNPVCVRFLSRAN